MTITEAQGLVFPATQAELDKRILRKADADKLRQAEVQKRQAAQESFDRCDTDGFVSQWADGICAQRDSLAAQVADNDGLWAFPALVDVETGQQVPAKRVYWLAFAKLYIGVTPPATAAAPTMEVTD